MLRPSKFNIDALTGHVRAKRKGQTDKRHPHSKSKPYKGKEKRRKSENKDLHRKAEGKRPVNDIEAKTLYTPTIEEWGEIVENEKSYPSFIDQILPAEPGEGILVAGRTGIGKTNLCMYMAYCLASGKPFYGFKCEKTCVAYFAFEGGKTNYLERNNKIKKLFPPDTGSRVRFALIPTQGPKEMYAEVIERLSELPDVKVVILDGARHIVYGDPSKTENAQEFIQSLKATLFELGMSSVLTFQITKPNKNSLVHPGDIYTIKGAVEFAAWSTTSLLLENKCERKM